MIHLRFLFRPLDDACASSCSGKSKYQVQILCFCSIFGLFLFLTLSSDLIMYFYCRSKSEAEFCLGFSPGQLLLACATNSRKLPLTRGEQEVPVGCLVRSATVQMPSRCQITSNWDWCSSQEKQDSICWGDSRSLTSTSASRLARKLPPSWFQAAWAWRCTMR